MAKATEKPTTAEDIDSILSADVVDVPWREIKCHPDNPRKGNVDAIADSLKEHGQFRPIIVQRSTGFIIGGNHTFLGTRKLSWPTVKVVYLDVDDQQAQKIMLADNRTSDLGTYDTNALARILSNISDPTGTGYSDSDVRAILASIEDEDTEKLVETLRPTPEIQFDNTAPQQTFDERVKSMQRAYNERIGDQLRGQVELTEEERGQLEQNITLAEIQDELEQLEDVIFPITDNYWGVPELRRDMLMESIPEPIETWGGQDVSVDDGQKQWLWNFGLAASKGLPWDRATMCMFTYDDNFKQWWESPAYQAAKVLYNGLKTAIVPDTSFWAEEPRYMHLQAAYRAQWIGRFLQETGVKVMPRLMWCDPESIKVGMLGIPLKPPAVAVCLQAASKEEFIAGNTAAGLREFIKLIQPESLLVYSGAPGRELTEDANLPKSLHVVYVENYAAVRRHVAYDRINGKTAVEKHIKSVERLDKFEARQQAEAEKEERRKTRAAAQKAKQVKRAENPAADLRAEDQPEAQSTQ